MFAVVRIRGNAGQRKKVLHTLRMLNLDSPHSCIIVPETPEYKGMVEVAKDTSTWGEISKETLTQLLKKRLRFLGNKRVDEKALKDKTGFDSFEKFSDAIFSGKHKLKDFKYFSPVLRLNSPSKGFKSVKEGFPKGDLGYRGKEINKLLEKMM